MLQSLVYIWQNVRQGDTPMRPEGIFHLSPFAPPPPAHYTYVAMNTTLQSSSINREMIHIPRGRLPSQSIWPLANINYRQINSGCLGIGALSCFFLSVLHFFLLSCSFSQGLIVVGCNWLLSCLQNYFCSALFWPAIWFVNRIDDGEKNLQADSLCTERSTYVLSAGLITVFNSPPWWHDN